MNRFSVFQFLLDYMSENSEITNAVMKDTFGKIYISGESEGRSIIIEVEMQDLIDYC